MARELYTGWGFRGYRPDTSTVYQMLEGRRTAPFISGMDVKSERRWAARFVTQTDLSITTMVAQMHARGPKIKAMLTYWGVDWRERRLMTDEEFRALGQDGQASAGPAAGATAGGVEGSVQKAA